VPVVGKVTAKGAPLKRGAVIFRPDTSKRGGAMQAQGAINTEGRYELYTFDKKGAVAGWYKVKVVKDDGTEEEFPSVEVSPSTAAGAYNLKVTK
jgi:hypothetical protein